MIGGVAKNPRTTLTLGIAAFRNKIGTKRTSERGLLMSAIDRCCRKRLENVAEQ
jgi:hypothetical protein